MNTESKAEYMFLFRGTDWHQGLSPEQIQSVMSQWKSWFETLIKQGKSTGGQPLQKEGKVISGKNGRVVADGPFAESKEAIGGYFMIHAKSLDEAVAIARGCPGLEYGIKIEVRAFAEQCPCAEYAAATAEVEHAMA